MKHRFKTGKSRNSSLSLNILTDDECHEIHLATLELLKNTGVYCESEEALAYFDGGGCKVDSSKKVVKFPNWVIEDAIRVTPSTFYCCGRGVKDDVILEDNRVTFTNFGEAIKFVDPYTGEHRDTTKADLIITTRIIDYLEHIDTCERAMVSGDRPPGVQEIHNADAMLNNTNKHLWLGPVNRYQARKVIEMCGVVVGGKENMKSTSQSIIIDRRMREDWQAAGEMDIYQRAQEKVVDILETYEPLPLSDDVRKNLTIIVEEAEQELGIG